MFFKPGRGYPRGTCSVLSSELSPGFRLLDEPMVPAAYVSRLGICDLFLKLHIYQQPWELTRLRPELSRAGSHLLQLTPSLPSPSPSPNSLGWAFCSLVLRLCSWCCRLGRGWRTQQKVCGRELSLSSKGKHGCSCPLLPI